MARLLYLVFAHGAKDFSRFPVAAGASSLGKGFQDALFSESELKTSESYEEGSDGLQVGFDKTFVSVHLPAI